MGGVTVTEQIDVQAHALAAYLAAVRDRKAHGGKCDQLFQKVHAIARAHSQGTLVARDGDSPSFYDREIDPGALCLPDHTEAVKVLADFQQAREREDEARHAAERAGVDFRDMK